MHPFTDSCDKDTLPKIETHLDLMKDDDDGKRLLQGLGTQSWGEVNQPRLDAAAALLALERKANAQK